MNKHTLIKRLGSNIPGIVYETDWSWNKGVHSWARWPTPVLRHRFQVTWLESSHAHFSNQRNTWIDQINHPHQPNIGSQGGKGNGEAVVVGLRAVPVHMSYDCRISATGSVPWALLPDNLIYSDPYTVLYRFWQEQGDSVDLIFLENNLRITLPARLEYKRNEVA